EAEEPAGRGVLGGGGVLQRLRQLVLDVVADRRRVAVPVQGGVAEGREQIDAHLGVARVAGGAVEDLARGVGGRLHAHGGGANRILGVGRRRGAERLGGGDHEPAVAADRVEPQPRQRRG